MTSQINPNNIDGTYPVAGQPNNTQGFRDNFTNIKTNFQTAATEITDLENKGIFKAALTGTTLDNNMADNLIYAVKLQDVSYTYIALTATAGSINIDYAAAGFQQISTTGSVSLSFSNWPASGSAGTVRVGFNITNVAHTVTLPAAVSQGITTIAGALPGTAGVSNTITFGAVGNYAFEFVTIDGGTTIWVFDDSRPPDTFTSNLTIANTRVSTSTTTGALVVGGGTGIGGNLNVGGDFTTYNISNVAVFNVAANTGYVHINTGVISANAEGALNIVGSGDGSYQPVTNAGGMIHITGNPGVASRITNDAFGTGAVPSYSSRAARGTAASPTAVQSGDTMSRYATVGWTGSTYNTGTGVSSTSIDVIALENYATGNLGSAYNFYTAPIGSNTRTLSANITANITTFPNAVSVTGNITSGNVLSTTLSLSGNVISALNITSNVTGGNVIAVSAVHGASFSATGNITTAGNILLSDGGTMGYNSGSGGTISQTGNKSTGVTLNKPAGEITMQNTALGAATTVQFTLTNSTIGARDVLLLNVVGGVATGASYNLDATCTTGSAVISVRNITAGSLSESIVLRYVVIRGSIA